MTLSNNSVGVISHRFVSIPWNDAFSGSAGALKRVEIVDSHTKHVVVVHMVIEHVSDNTSKTKLYNLEKVNISISELHIIS